MPTKFIDMLETFDNDCPQRNYVIEINCPEFTSVCPKRGSPILGICVLAMLRMRNVSS